MAEKEKGYLFSKNATERTARVVREAERDRLDLRGKRRGQPRPEATSVPTGCVIAWSGDPTSPPTDWLLCDGSEVAKTTYPDLYAVVGTTYGTPADANKFTLPNLTSRFILAQGQTGTPPGTFFNRGEYGGEENHTLTLGEIPTHSHQSGDGFDFITSDPGGAINVDTDGNNAAVSYTNTQPTTDDQGDGFGHNNMPPYLVMSYIIKT